ncbi:phosphatidylinositol-specific phospholipase C1-like protein [Zunongwangia sp. SCSIO 43204]|uniref:phosphatidylinositol-specific phospholipase C1-like protein n=1 Tax=Zunongwangia sp. SCSIO 43204 TaxID=2779359 RepID=UPI001CAA1779|nr:phosphatidylinositol-specific phospholipase C1-like protein [Zunongwangia sp. SCSIO 43204]UAB85610.1 phosphatidylinositol-specific phospholipase C1-like protein [Zunongwangia sp. SCSIO 43204]
MVNKLSIVLFSLICIYFISACSDKPKSKQKINQVQVIGSHNSYKKAIEDSLYAYLESQDSLGRLKGLQYDHIPMLQQLSMGLRNLEVDVYIDKNGGKFSNPKGLSLAEDQSKYDPENKLEEPGFKMIHIPDIDFRTQYYLFENCLKDLKSWSEENPDHTPIFITLEPKDGEENNFGTSPDPFTAEAYQELDDIILESLGKEHIITPDDIRADYKTLNEAVTVGNWPTIDEAKGKFMFILDTKGAKMELYIKDHPSLKDRVSFTNSKENSPEAAAMIINDPYDKRISDLVKKGYIIRTRADANTTEARNNDYSRFKTAKKSGAQIITTDYYLPSKFFDSDYQIDFGKNIFYRKNPINSKS